MKKSIALFLAVCLFIGSPFMAFAAKPEVTGRPVDVVTPLYLNLGDSIAYGMSAEPGQSYFDRYARTLKPGMAVNEGMAGLTSGELMSGLSDDYVRMAVGSADVITISIGGNNLLRPVIMAVFEVYEIYYGPDTDMETALSDLYGAIQWGESQLPGTWNMLMQELLLSAQNQAFGELGYYLTAGAAGFVDDWALMMGSIRATNDHAAIKVLNLYNPVKQSDNPILQELFEVPIMIMNGVIDGYQDFYHYEVIDVYTAFMKDSRAVAFNLQLDELNLDPHPTTKGHQIIFRELMKSKNIRSPIAGKPLDSATLEIDNLMTKSAETASLPEAHNLTGSVFGGLVAEKAQEDPGTLADHVSGNAAGLPAANQDELGEPLSVYEFGQAVSAQVREDVDVLVQHVRGR